MNMLSKLWHLVYAPPVLCGPYFFLTDDETWPVKARQRMLREAFPHRPRWQWGIRFVVQTCAWYGFGAWRALWKSHCLRREIAPDESSPELRLFDLCLLAFWYGADPRYYYIYRLYQRPQAEWLDYVYPQELPNWHLMAGMPGGEADRESLADKHRFSQLMAEAGLPCIGTLQRIEKGSAIIESDVFQKKACFFKPNNANAMRGCFELQYDSTSDGYKLSGMTVEGSWCCHEARSSILQCLEKQVLDWDYLVQPLLRNHSKMTELFGEKELITLRVITLRKESGPVVVYALLEVPAEEPFRWVMGNVDPDTGQMIESQALQYGGDRSYQKVIEPVIGHELPFWQESWDMLCQAHELFPKLMSVGWDLAITDSGPLIIEGNTGWDVVSPQEVSGRGVVPLAR